MKALSLVALLGVSACTVAPVAPVYTPPPVVYYNSVPVYRPYYAAPYYGYRRPYWHR